MHKDVNETMNRRAGTEDFRIDHFPNLREAKKTTEHFSLRDGTACILRLQDSVLEEAAKKAESLV